MGQESSLQIHLSAPGISKNHQVAVVYIALSFAGECFAMHKKDNRWIVDPEWLCPSIS